MFECWHPLLDQSWLFDNGGWRKVSEWCRTLQLWLPWGGCKVIFTFDLLVFHCFWGYIFFIKLHSKSEVIWLDVQFEVMVSRGHNVNVEWLQTLTSEGQNSQSSQRLLLEGPTRRGGYVQMFSECFSWFDSWTKKPLNNTRGIGVA